MLSINGRLRVIELDEDIGNSGIPNLSPEKATCNPEATKVEHGGGHGARFSKAREPVTVLNDDWYPRCHDLTPYTVRALGETCLLPAGRRQALRILEGGTS